MQKRKSIKELNEEMTEIFNRKPTPEQLKDLDKVLRDEAEDLESDTASDKEDRQIAVEKEPQSDHVI